LIVELNILGDSDRPLTNQDLISLEYLECSIKETLRLYPSVPILGRKVAETCIIGIISETLFYSVIILAFFNQKIYQDSKVIPKNTDCVIFLPGIHRDERYFPEPEIFDPNRFLPENCNRHTYSFIPFSADRRNCIGQRFSMMEIKVMLANVLRKFEIKSLKSLEELEPVLELVMKPSKGVIPIELMIRK
jgi:cytochrome P450